MIGVIVGVLLGPAVLGRIAPGTYSGMFGGNTLASQLHALSQQHAQPDAQVTPGQVQAMLARHREQVRDQRAAGWAGAIMLAGVGVMTIESVVAPSMDHAGERAEVPRALPRLVSVRYALGGAWLAVVLARPTLLSHLPLVFTAVLIALALGVGLVPLGPRPPHDSVRA